MLNESEDEKGGFLHFFEPDKITVKEIRIFVIEPTLNLKEIDWDFSKQKIRLSKINEKLSGIVKKLREDELLPVVCIEGINVSIESPNILLTNGLNDHLQKDLRALKMGAPFAFRISRLGKKINFRL